MYIFDLQVASHSVAARYFPANKMGAPDQQPAADSGKTNLDLSWPSASIFLLPEKAELPVLSSRYPLDYAIFWAMVIV
jgi:hypothetical protein